MTSTDDELHKELGSRAVSQPPLARFPEKENRLQGRVKTQSPRKEEREARRSADRTYLLEQRSKTKITVKWSFEVASSFITRSFLIGLRKICCGYTDRAYSERGSPGENTKHIQTFG